MNKVLSLLHAARASSDPVPVLNSDHMLSELLTLHDEMIMQLHLERLQAVGNIDFLTGLIEQHEKTAAMLREKLELRDAGISPDGLVVITGEASSAANKSLVTESAEGARGENVVRNDMTIKDEATQPSLPNVATAQGRSHTV